MTTASPTSIQEAEQHIVQKWQQGQRVHLTRTPVEPGAVSLSLDGLNRIQNLNADDAVAILEAGVTIQAIRDAVASVGLWCPALRHLPADERIGAAVAGGHGGRSRGYPGLADCLLGSAFVCPSVGLVRHGGTAIKNASGYNLTGLLAGSRGSFGIILSVNLRLVPVPRARECRSYHVARWEAALAAAALAGTVPVSAPDRFDAQSVLVRLRPDQADAEILVEVADASRDGVSARVERLETLASRHGARPTPVTDWSSRPSGTRLQCAVSPGELAEHVAAALAGGAPSLAELRFEATGGGIEVWVADPSPELRSRFSRSEPSSLLRETFRKAFDPHGLLDDEHSTTG